MKVQAILNSRVSEATGLSPIQILYAGQIDLHEGRLFPQPTAKQRKAMSQYMANQLKFQEDLMERAVKHQESINDVHLSHKKEDSVPLEVGTYVSVRHESGEPPTKLAARWHGPYRILSVVSRPQGRIYECYSPATGKIMDFHETFVQAHPCRDDVECARSNTLDDYKLFLVEKVLEHKITERPGRTVALDLRIKWVREKEPEWTGINISLKRNFLVQEYFKKE